MGFLFGCGNYTNRISRLIFTSSFAVAQRLTCWDFTFEGVRSVLPGTHYPPASFTELFFLFLKKYFFLRHPMAGTEVTVLLRRLRGKRPWENFCCINITSWLEQIWPVSEHCFNFVHSLEGNWRRHQNLQELTSLELNLDTYPVFCLSDSGPVNQKWVTSFNVWDTRRWRNVLRAFEK